MRRVSTAAAAGVGVLTTALAGWVLDRWPPLGAARWVRSNHAGDPVTLLEGPQVVVGSALAALITGAPVAAVSAIVAGGFGALDDLTGDRTRTGLRGHLGALGRGQVTTGAVKVVGLVVAGLVVGRTARGSAPGRSAGPTAHVRAARRSGRVGAGGPADALQVLVDAGVVAGTANLVNLLDLRPGRALKVTLLLGTPLAATGSTAAAAVVGACLAAFPQDVAARAMLGDTGANALGAVLGSAAVDRLPRPGRWAVLTGLVALTLASERVSFTAVIDRTPALRRIDAWGRRPAARPAGRHR